MGLSVNTNIASLIAQRNVTKANQSYARSIQRLSSGLRINTAADDAAGLAVSEKLKAHTRSINQAVRNANDAVSLIKTADGALSQIGNILQRMREIAEESSNSQLQSSERLSLDSEFQSLKSEINRISDATEFNGQKLIDGTISSSALSFQIGFQNVSANDRISLTVSNSDASALTIHAGTVNDISTAGHAQSALTQIDSAISLVAKWRGSLGAKESRLNVAIANLSTTSTNYSSAVSNITDADFAQETAKFTRNKIMTQAAVSILAQANTLPQQALTLLR